MTNLCFEIRASSDLDEVKVQKKSTLNRFEINFGSCYERIICLYPRLVIFCSSELGPRVETWLLDVRVSVSVAGC